MHGNVFQWVEDRWHENYENAPTDGSVWPGGQEFGPRVLRGGSWGNNPPVLRPAFRGKGYPDDRYSLAGFRLAMTL
jgi:formylglycine-generating enzyme required for sulfatase activity